jgi:(5-formylfuran-3-yl)methyl phosphate synthase
MTADPAREAAATRLLVSVRDAREAELAAAAGPYLIDIKDPANGALGALPPAAIRAIVARLGSRSETSAVAGEPDSWAALVEAVRAVAATGVGMVKVAAPAAADAPPASLGGRLSGLPCPVVLVRFAEDGLESLDVVGLAAAGFKGVMIDTRRKDGTGLLDRLALPALAGFVRAGRAAGLMTGLAGSLRLSDIPVLAPLRPTYLGFRGGLCRSGRRRDRLDPARLADALAVLASSRHDRAAA